MTSPLSALLSAADQGTIVPTERVGVSNLPSRTHSVPGQLHIRGSNGPNLNGRDPASMVIGMANMRKVTITLSEATLEAVRRLVEAGSAPSVSGFVQHAVGLALDDVAAWMT